MGSDNDDAGIIEAYLRGEKSAFGRVEELISAAYRSWGAKFGYEADDVRSDIRLKLLLSFQRPDFSINSSLQAFVRQVVNHTCIDYYRFQKRRPHIDMPEEGMSSDDLPPDRLYERREDARLYFRALRLVSKDCVKLLRLRVLKGLKYREIGEKLGKPEETVRWRIHDCRKRANEIAERIEKKGQRSAD